MGFRWLPLFILAAASMSPPLFLLHRLISSIHSPFPPPFTLLSLLSHSGAAFAHLGKSSSDLQLRLFICFLIILNLPALVNSIIGKVFEMRMLFEVRESPSKVYGWVPLVTAIVASIIPVAALASVFWFLFAFFIPFYSRESSVAGYFYLMTLLFQIFGCQFAFMLAASCATPIIAS